MSKIILGVSNRHLHLSASDFKLLFGYDQPIKKADLLQPGQFAAQETVNLKTAKAELKNVRLIAPFRPYTQVEISPTDAYFLGLKPPVRDSGDLNGAAKITIVGPAGKIEREAAILAARHLHLTPQDQINLDLTNQSEISIKLQTEINNPRDEMIFTKVRLKVSPQAQLELHLDTDEANAALAHTGDEVIILK